MKTTQFNAAQCRTVGNLALLGAGLFMASVPSLAAPVTPQKADRFVDSMGVNTHFDHSWSYGAPGTSNYTQVKQKLQELGIRHVRSTASTPTVASAECISAAKDLYSTLGIKTTFICGRKVSSSLDSSQVDNELDSLESIASSIAALEGPNEYDVQSPKTETTWASKLVGYQKALYNAAHNSTLHAPLAGIPIIGPSMGSAGNASQVYAANGNANLGPWLDYACLHQYQSSRWPGTTGYGNNGYGSIDWGINTAAIPLGGSKPIQSTECGYNTGNTGEDRYVTPDVEARYLPRMYAEFFRRGFFRSFKYEMLDDAAENGFGLLDSSFNGKPAFYAIKNLVAAMKDPSPSTNFTPTALDYTLTGAGSDTRQMLFQKSDGSYMLMLWRETSSMNPDTKAAITVTPDDVTLTLPASITGVSTNLPKNNATFSSATLSGGQVSLSVPDHLLLVRLTGPTTTRYEVENLTRQAISSGDTTSNFSEAALSGGAAVSFPANAAGDFVTYAVNVPQSGTYRILVGVKKYTGRGIFQLATSDSLSGTYTNRGAAQDTFNTSATFPQLDLGTVTFSTAGTKSFRFSVTGKNSSSSGFGVTLDYIQLNRS